MIFDIIVLIVLLVVAVVTELSVGGFVFVRGSVSIKVGILFRC